MHIKQECCDVCDVDETSAFVANDEVEQVSKQQREHSNHAHDVDKAGGESPDFCITCKNLMTTFEQGRTST